MERQARDRTFENYLRTGGRPIERKFNPYHDPENGRFTFAPGGSGYGPGSVNVDLATGVQSRRDGSVTIPLDPPQTRASSYRMADTNVVIPPQIERKIEAIGSEFSLRTGKTLTVVSGRRTAASQATAMFDKFQAGATGADYRNHIALTAVRQAYQEGLAAKKDRVVVIADMTGVIDHQMSKNVFISRHLTGWAIDIRTREQGFRQAELAVLRAAITRQGGKIHSEGRPPHIHVQF